MGTVNGEDNFSILRYFFGYLCLNPITLFWSYVGIQELREIANSPNPKCLDVQGKRSILVDIIIGIMLSFPFILMLAFVALM